MSTLLLSFAALLPLISHSYAGSILLGGDDLTQHGRHIPFSGENQQGWKYIELAIKQLLTDSTLPGRDGEVTLLGSEQRQQPFSEDAGSAYYFAALANNYTVNFVNDAFPIQNFFDDLRSGVAKPSMIALAGSDANNDLSEAEANVITENTDALKQYIDDGGSVMSHTGAAEDYVYNWLLNATGVVDAVGCDANGASITSDGRAVFDQLADSDIDATAGPCHNHFVPPFAGFQTFAFDGQGRSFIIMSRGSIEEVPTIRLNCSDSTAAAGEWSIALESHFNVSFFADAGVSGDAFELMIQDVLNNDTDFLAAGCTATFPGALQIACPSSIFDRFDDMSFEGNTLVCFEGSCVPFEDFGLNGLACPEPACPVCDEVPIARVCDQRENIYPSECELNRLSCLFPADPLELTPCPATPMPTPAPTAAPPTPMPTVAPPSPLPTSAPTAAPTASPTAAPTSEPTASPTSEPTASPTSEPTATPTSAPTMTPTAPPTGVPTSEPTATPTSAPTTPPTAVPTAQPTSSPTNMPTVVPTSAPTQTPTSVPTSTPTGVPTSMPTSVPTPQPTSSPTPEPTGVPTPTPTFSPSPAPSNAPIPVPTLMPTPVPTLSPVPTPTGMPTVIKMPVEVPVPSVVMPTPPPAPTPTPILPTSTPMEGDAGEIGSGDTSVSGSTSSAVLSNAAIAGIVVGVVAAGGGGAAAYYKYAR